MDISDSSPEYSANDISHTKCLIDHLEQAPEKDGEKDYYFFKRKKNFHRIKW